MKKRNEKQTVIEAVSPGMCTGCSACINSCPRKALSFKVDRFGYFVPEIDESKCDRCGLCYRICPAINLPSRKSGSPAPTLYAFIAKNRELLQKSSSGGAFGVMAENVLSRGGAVSGCAWCDDWNQIIRDDANDSENMEETDLRADTHQSGCKKEIKPLARHIVIDKAEDLEKLHKSKYFQSYMGTVFSDIAKLLKQGKLVLFSGCPCQVAGLRAFLRKDYGNLICIDLLCGNSPAQAFFAEYIRESFPVRPELYEFRNKTSGKWQTHTVKVSYADGNASVVHKSTDIYQKAYHPHIMIPPHCEHCRYQVIPRLGDITIGDFWGISKKDPHLDCKQGLSVVLVNNNKGKDFLKSIPVEDIGYLEEKPLGWLGGNGSALKGTHNWSSPGTSVFYSLILKNGFKEAVNAALAVNSGEDVSSLKGIRLVDAKGTEISFQYNAKFWEQHCIQGVTCIFSKTASGEASAYATLNKKTVCGQDYVIAIKFRIATDCDKLDFYLLNRKLKREQFVVSHGVISTDRFKTVSMCVKFTANGSYDSIMIKSSQIIGNLSYIAFEEIVLIEYHNNPYGVIPVCSNKKGRLSLLKDFLLRKFFRERRLGTRY